MVKFDVNVLTIVIMSTVYDAIVKHKIGVLPILL